MNITEMNRDSLIPLKKYKTFGEIQDAPIISAIQCITRMKPSNEKDFLSNWLFTNHYLNKKRSGSLTDRIKNFNNKICFNHLCKEYFNGFDINKCISNIILPKKATDIIKKLNLIQGSLTGTYIDYLMRRIISEINHSDFNDNRTNTILNKNKNKIIYTENGHVCSLGCKCIIESDNCWQYTQCRLNYCQYESYNKVKNTEKYKIKDTIVDIFIISLCHSECFGGCPNQDKVELILKEITNVNFYDDFIIPLYEYCNKLILNKKEIHLNPILGSSKNMIPADCDLIIDDMLIDIKCTKGINTISEILQLLGYSSLNLDFIPIYGIPIKQISIINILEGVEYIYDISNISKASLLDYLILLQDK